jgi:phosphoglycerate dehydrogenase-like enzyme
MEKFRIALSDDFLKPDGSPAYPNFDLTPLHERPNVEAVYIPAGKVIRAEDMDGFDALILLATRFERESFPSDGRLCIVARFGVGFDTVDAEACSDNSVALVITPDGVRRPVAVAIVTFILALTGKLMAKDRLTREGPTGWAEKSAFMGVGLVDKTLGSLGVGNIGSEMFRLARPFDMRFIANDPYVEPQGPESLGVRLVGLDELFEESDILAINCPLSEETHRLVDAALLARMKPTAYFINTARGPIVDQDALIEALTEGRIAGAGLDVFVDEPSAVEDPLTKLDNVILTPHALCWTDQCFGGIGAADVKAVLDVMHGREPTGIVNRGILEDSAWRDKLAANRMKFGEG